MKVGDKVDIICPTWLAEKLGIGTVFTGIVIDPRDQAVRVDGHSVLRAPPPNKDGAIECRLCKRPLTDEASKSIGFGPECALRLGISNKFVKDLKQALRRDEIQSAEKVTHKVIWFPRSQIRIVPAGMSVVEEAATSRQMEEQKAASPITYMEDMKHEEISDEPLPIPLPFDCEPRPYQWRAIRFGLEQKRFGNFDLPGVGKTIEAIGFMIGANIQLQSVGKHGPVMVICPPVVALTWKRTIEQWWQGVRVQLLKGYSAKADKKAHVYVIPNSILAKGWETRKDARGHIVYDQNGKPRKDMSRVVLTGSILSVLEQAPIIGVIDESHAFKGMSSQRTVAALQTTMTCEYLTLMTGTAVMNRPQELTPQLDILGKLKPVFGGADAFEVEFAGKHLEDTPRRGGMRKTWQYGKPSKATLIRLHDALAPFTIRRKSSDVIKDMPPLSIARVIVELANRREYDELEAEIAELPPMQKLGKLAQLRQVCGIGKIPSAIEWIENFLECDEKLVVFATHRAVQRALLEHFEKWNPVPILGQSEGGSITKNQAGVDAFQTDPNRILAICSTGAAREGITLTAASNMLTVELEWVPAVLAQAWARIHRYGQTNPVTIWNLVAEDSFDDTLSEKLVNKRLITGEILDREGEVLDETELRNAVVKDLVRRVARRRVKKKEVA